MIKYGRKASILSGFFITFLTVMFFNSNNAFSAFGTDTVMVTANFSELAEKTKPSVVNIRTVKTIKGGGHVFKHFLKPPFGGKSPFDDFFGPFFDNGPAPDYKQRSLGSGFIIERDGYIVTNNHVIENADQIKVTLSDEKEYDAKVIGRDPKTDLALIKISSAGSLTPCKLGDSDKLKVGSWVVAIGSPFGLEQTVTAGIVSAKGRKIGSGPYDDFIQTDASINPGNSGGPLINLEGEVVGINTAIVTGGQGIGFAIPINLAKGIIEQLKQSGEVTRGWLGVGIQELTPELAQYYGIKEKAGILVTQVYEGDPAYKAGIQPKDVIISVDGKTFNTPKELSMTIAKSAVGKQVSIELIREVKNKTVEVTLGKQKASEMLTGSSEEGEDLGMKLADITPEIADRLGLPEDETGVVIADIMPGSKADNAELRQGDLIKEINRNLVNNIEDFHAVLKKIKPGGLVQLLVKRGNMGYFVVTINK